jgi:hypothetical protein
MSAKRGSIAQVMMVIALAAVNLAILRASPWELVSYPTIWVFLGAIDFVTFWKLILRRSLRAFHYTFLIVLVIAFVVMANLVATERFAPLGLLVRWYQQHAEANTIRNWHGLIWIGEFWMACFLSLMLASALGLVAAWLERRRGWDIAAFFRGALVGYGIAGLLATIARAAWGGAEPPSVLIGVRVTLVACLILGGRMGLSRLKSSSPVQESQSGQAEVSP